MLNIVLFGPPGSGKGTQAVQLVEKYNLVHLSTGDIFRANIKGETELGKLAKSYMDRGALVPDEVTIDMLQDAVNKHPQAAGFIFDGFPRNVFQAEALDRFLATKGTGVTMMLSLQVDDEELKRRIIERGKISGRTDDQDPAIVENRIRVYNTETAPVASFYAEQMKYYGVDGMLSIDEVFESLCFAIRLATEKSEPKKAPAPKKAAKKSAPKKKAAAKKSAPAKKAVKKKAAKKTTAKKAVKKAVSKKKPVKKAAAKKAVKKAAKKAVKKQAKKVVARKSVKKNVRKAAAKKPVKKSVKKLTPKKQVKKAVAKKKSRR